MKYQIVITDDPELLVEKVNEQLKEGWKPHGSMTMQPQFQYGYVYVQPLVHYEGK